MEALPDIARLIANRRPGYSLPAPFYVSPEVFARDVRLIFGRHWIYVGVEPDVPEPGDCMMVDIGPHSAIVVRHDDMSVRAYHNVCRHRGARLSTSRRPRRQSGLPLSPMDLHLDGELIFAAPT